MPTVAERALVTSEPIARAGSFSLRRGTIIIALLLGLVFRLSFIALLDYKLVGDPRDYDRLGYNLLVHHVFSTHPEAPFTPTMARAPGFPLLLAGMYALFGHHLFPVQALQALLNVAAAFLLFLALRRLAPTVASPAFAFMLLSPFDAAFAVAMFPETLCGFCLAVALVVPILLPGQRAWLISGVALGVAALGRDIYLGLVPIVALAVLLLGSRMFGRAKESVGERAKMALVLVLAAVATIAPWTVRNYRLTGEFVPVSRGLMWLNLWVGTWERWGVEWPGLLDVQAYRNEADRQDYLRISKIADEKQYDQEMRRLTLQRYREEPLRAAKIIAMRYPQLWIGNRFFFFFRPAPLSGSRMPALVIKAALVMANIVLTVLAFFGTGHALRARSKLLWLALPIFYTALVYIPFHNSEPRYNQPLLLVMLAFAALELFAIFAPERLGQEFAVEKGVTE